MKPATLAASDFPSFFRELWGEDCDPFPWQYEFACRLCSGKAPDYVSVPTGSGKTACIDAAVFALALQAALPVADRTQGRRIFFIVNRRVIVDEAYVRASHLCKKLRDAASDSVLGRVAAALHRLSGESDSAPLTCTQLRGGIYQDRSWAGSLLQPMIICSTVDQAGSRLLFRGYGVSPQARPIHAALVAHDSLLIIDEAHISRPFIQTLEWVQQYRCHRPTDFEAGQLPFQFIQMTATPPADTRNDQQIILSAEDHNHPVLKPRLLSAKPARLIIEQKAKGKNRQERNNQLANRLVEETEKILADEAGPPRSVAIMVNRVATARAIAAKLEKTHKGCVTLLIGRMRPLDREAATKEIHTRLKTGAISSAPESGPLLVVSTQCLEVGADLDFDALVTEAASLDALRQRFGRVNRGGRKIVTRAVIVLPGDQDLPADKLDEAAPCDSIYGNAIPRTWCWLNGLAQGGVVDFGINKMNTAVDSLRATGRDEGLTAMLSPTADAPVLLPAYLDCWVQTNPAPAADPDIALFLHGPEQEMVDVQVCWRGDLPEAMSDEDWADIISLCPPTGAECLPVPLHVFRNWLNSKGEFTDESGDVVEREKPAERKLVGELRSIPVFIWRGLDEHFFVHRTADICPGDTIVLRVQSGGWQALGHLYNSPDDPQAIPDKLLTPDEIRRVDVAERAAIAVRHRAVFRIHPSLWPKPEDQTTAAALWNMPLDSEQDWPVEEIKDLLTCLLRDNNPRWELTTEQREAITHLSKKSVALYMEPYPNSQGFVLTTRDLLPSRNSEETIATGDCNADTLLEAAQPQELFDHTNAVLARIEKSLALLPLSAFREVLLSAAAVHDWGKVDPRFQALLRGTTPFAAMASEVFLAKSRAIASTFAARAAAKQRAELPKGFRHEMLSVQMAENPLGSAFLPANTTHRALALYLVATHHGYGRPFAPLSDDDVPPTVRLSTSGKVVVVTTAERLEHPAHLLDSGIAERFWLMNRTYGWWGAAFLETVLRLADQTASANPQSVSKP